MSYLSILESYLYKHEGKYEPCEHTARRLAYSLYHKTHNPSDEDWMNWENYYVCKLPTDTKSRKMIFNSIAHSLEQNKYIGVALTSYQDNRGKDDVDHVLIILPYGRIVHSYVDQFPVKVEMWDYVDQLNRLFDDPSIWSKLFEVEVNRDPDEIYVSLFY